LRQKKKEKRNSITDSKLDNLLTDLNSTQDGPNSIPAPSPRSKPTVALTTKEEKWGRWGPADASHILVRGKTYLEDQKKSTKSWLSV